MMDLHELFREESKVLHRSQDVAAQTSLSAEDCRDALLMLNRHYQCLRCETYRMISRSDRAERELNRVNEQLHQLAQELEYKASHDPLTAVWNHGAIIQRIIPYPAARPSCADHPHIDHFKKINDEHGHPMGDKSDLRVGVAHSGVLPGRRQALAASAERSLPCCCRTTGFPTR